MSSVALNTRIFWRASAMTHEFLKRTIKNIVAAATSWSLTLSPELYFYIFILFYFNIFIFTCNLSVIQPLGCKAFSIDLSMYITKHATRSYAEVNF